MTLKEFRELTKDSPEDSELIFCRDCIYLGDKLLAEEEEFNINKINIAYCFTNDTNYIFLHDN